MAAVVALIPTILAVAIGLGIGIAKGGSVENLRQWRPASAEVAGAGIVSLILSDVLPTTSLIVLLLQLAGIFSLLYASWMNRRVGGMVVIATGLFLNLAATFPNGGTPVSPDALKSAGFATSASIDKIELTGGRVVRSDEDLFAFLGDNFAIPGPMIVSIGDIISWVGIGLATQSIVRRRQVRSGRDSKPRRNPVNTPATYQEALSTLGMGPALNPLESAFPAGTGHPQSGLVKRLPPEGATQGTPAPAATRSATILPQLGTSPDDGDSVVRILPGPPSQPTVDDAGNEDLPETPDRSGATDSLDDAPDGADSPEFSDVISERGPDQDLGRNDLYGSGPLSTGSPGPASPGSAGPTSAGPASAIVDSESETLRPDGDALLGSGPIETLIVEPPTGEFESVRVLRPEPATHAIDLNAPATNEGTLRKSVKTVADRTTDAPTAPMDGDPPTEATLAISFADADPPPTVTDHPPVMDAGGSMFEPLDDDDPPTSEFKVVRRSQNRKGFRLPKK